MDNLIPDRIGGGGAHRNWFEKYIKTVTSSQTIHTKFNIIALIIKNTYQSLKLYPLIITFWKTESLFCSIYSWKCFHQNSQFYFYNLNCITMSEKMSYTKDHCYLEISGQPNFKKFFRLVFLLK